MKMQSKILFCCVALALAQFTLPAKAEVRFATINLQKVFDKYWKRDQAQAALKDKQDALIKDQKTMVEDLKKLQTDYERLTSLANDQSVTQTERDKRKATADNKALEINTAKASIQQFVENNREQLENQFSRIRNSIIEDITAAVKAKAQAAGYTMVIDTAAETANGTPVLLYNNGENDLTDVILNQLNATAPASRSPSLKSLTDTNSPATGTNPK